MAQQFYQIIGSEGKVQMISQDQLQQFCPDLYATQVESGGKTIQYVLNQEEPDQQHQVVIQQSDQQQVILTSSDGQHMLVEQTNQPQQLTYHQHHQLSSQSQQQVAQFLVQCTPANSNQQFITQTKTLNVHQTSDVIEYATPSQTQQVFYATPVAEETHITTTNLNQPSQISQVQLQTTVAPSHQPVDQHMQQYQRFLATQKAKTELVDAADAAQARQRGLQQQQQTQQSPQQSEQPQQTNRTIVAVGTPLNRNINQANQQKVLNQYVQQQQRQPAQIMQTQTSQQITTQKQVVMPRSQIIQQPYMDQQMVHISDGRQMTYGEFKLLQSQQNKPQPENNEISSLNSPAVTNALLQNRQINQQPGFTTQKTPTRKRQYPRKNNTQVESPSINRDSIQSPSIQAPNVTVNKNVGQQVSIRPSVTVNQTSNVITQQNQIPQQLSNVHQVTPTRMVRPSVPALQQIVRPNVPTQQQIINMNSGLINRGNNIQQQNIVMNNQAQTDTPLIPVQTALSRHGQQITMTSEMGTSQASVPQQIQQGSPSVPNDFRNIVNQTSLTRGHPNRGRRHPNRGTTGHTYHAATRGNRGNSHCIPRTGISSASDSSNPQSPQTPTQSSASGTSQSEPSSPGCDEIRHTAKMLVMLENGEQRLITFSLPKESCTVTELLEQVLLQVNVDFIPGVSQIRCANHPGAEIEYIVTVTHGPTSDSPPSVGSSPAALQQVSPVKQPTHTPEISRQPPSLQQAQIQCAPQPTPVTQSSIMPSQQSSFQQSFCSKTVNNQTKKGVRNTQNNITSSIQPNTFQHQLQQSIIRGKSPDEQLTPVKEPSPPKEVDAPRYVSGMLALCRYCGYTSVDFNKCQRCKRKLPEDPKAIPISSVLGVSKNSNSSDSDSNKSGILDVRKSNLNKTQSDSTTKLSGVVKTKPRRGKQKVPDPEPEILTLSSDEDDNSKHEKCEEEQSTVVTKETLGLLDKEPLILKNDTCKLENHEDNENINKSTILTGCQQLINKDGENIGLNQINSEENSETKMTNNQEIVKLACRSIRIGSYKCIPTEKVIITSEIIRLVVPSRTQDSVVLEMKRGTHIVKILAHFTKMLPFIALYNVPSYSATVREQLKMINEHSDYFYDSGHPRLGALRRIILLPLEVTAEDARKIRSYFKNHIDEISHAEANSVLIRACAEINCDKDGSVNNSTEKKSDSFIDSNKVIPKNSTGSLHLNNSQDRAYQNLLVYPRNAKGGITINTGDYACLATDQFLNDVIIDFYLKYILDSTLSEEDRKKYHVFSTFFYNRLTLKAHANNRKAMLPFENDSTLTPPQRRHMRVRRWTRSVNIFEKDYVIIPINESSHWFLAIICFPGLDCARLMIDNKPVDLDNKSKEKKAVKTLIGNSITVKKEGKVITVKSDELEEGCSDRDEAEGSDSDLEQDNEETETCGEEVAETSGVNTELDSNNEIVNTLRPKPVSVSSKSNSSRDTDRFKNAIKQPCILIFDSLAGGASRSRVVATLRDYLTWEHREKYKSNITFTKHNMRGHCPKVPQQNNFTDCGLYVLQYVESFVTDPIKDYRIPIKHLKEWFDELTVTKKREDISLLIKDLMTEYDLDLTILPNLNFPTLNGILLDTGNEDHEEEEEHQNTSSHDEEHDIQDGSFQEQEEIENDAHSGSLACEVDSEEHERMEFEAEETNFLETLIEKQKKKSDTESKLQTDSDKDLSVSPSNSDERKSSSSSCLIVDKVEHRNNEFTDENSVNVIRSSDGLGMISQYSDSNSPTPQQNKSNRDTMSYLKAKRIVRHKNCENNSDTKRQKVEFS